MYRLIPFKSMDDINISVHPKDLYKSICKEPLIYVQSTDDMIVKPYSIDELRKIEENFDFYYYETCFRGVSFIDELEDKDDVVSVDACWYAIDNEYFLDDNFKVKSIEYTTECVDYFMDLDTSTTWGFRSSFGSAISYKGNIFKLEFMRAKSHRGDLEYLLLANGVPLYKLSSNTREMLGYEFFEIIQICKTENEGFDIVVYFSDMYFGISLDSNLKVLKFHNLEENNFKRLPDNYKIECAKRKLLQGVKSVVRSNWDLE